MIVPRILTAMVIAGYGALGIADPLAAALRPYLGLDAPAWAVLGAPLIVAGLTAIAAALTRPVSPARPR